MKNTGKKFFVLVMTMVLGFGLILGGCGKSATDNTTNNTTDNTPATFKIGGLFSLTGQIAFLGQGDKEGTEMAVEDINKDGGLTINGKKVKVELVSYDIGDDVAKSVEMAQRLINNDKVKLVNGPENHNQVAAALKVTDAAQVLTYNGISASNTFSVGSKYGFNMTDNGPSEQHGVFQFLQLPADKLKAAGLDQGMVDRIKKVKKYVFFGREEPYSLSGVAGAKEAAAKYGYDFAAVLYPAGTTDFLSYINKVKAEKPDFLFMNNYSADQIIPPMKDMLQVGGLDWNKDIVMMGNDVYGAPFMIEDAKKQGVNFDGTLFFNQTSIKPNPGVQAFNDRLVAKYGKDAINVANYTAVSYGATLAMLKGVEASGTITDADKMVQGIKRNVYKGLSWDWKVLDQKQFASPEFYNIIKTGGQRTDLGISFQEEAWWGSCFWQPAQFEK